MSRLRARWSHQNLQTQVKLKVEPRRSRLGVSIRVVVNPLLDPRFVEVRYFWWQQQWLRREFSDCDFVECGPFVFGVNEKHQVFGEQCIRFKIVMLNWQVNNACVERAVDQTGIKLEVLPSEIVQLMFGNFSASTGRKRGINHRPVVPMLPKRVSPAISFSLDSTAAAMSWI